MARVAMMEGMKLRWEKARAENNNDEDRAKHPLKLQSIIDPRNPDDNLTKRRTLILSLFRQLGFSWKSYEEDPYGDAINHTLMVI
jgi:hypothetical protein